MYSFLYGVSRVFNRTRMFVGKHKEGSGRIWGKNNPLRDAFDKFKQEDKNREFLKKIVLHSIIGPLKGGEESKSAIIKLLKGKETFLGFDPTVDDFNISVIKEKYREEFQKEVSQKELAMFKFILNFSYNFAATEYFSKLMKGLERIKRNKENGLESSFGGFAQEEREIKNALIPMKKILSKIPGYVSFLDLDENERKAMGFRPTALEASEVEKLRGVLRDQDCELLIKKNELVNDYYEDDYYKDYYEYVALGCVNPQGQIEVPWTDLGLDIKSPASAQGQKPQGASGVVSGAEDFSSGSSFSAAPGASSGSQLPSEKPRSSRLLASSSPFLTEVTNESVANKFLSGLRRFRPVLKHKFQLETSSFEAKPQDRFDFSVRNDEVSEARNALINERNEVSSGKDEFNQLLAQIIKKAMDNTENLGLDLELGKKFEVTSFIMIAVKNQGFSGKRDLLKEDLRKIFFEDSQYQETEEKLETVCKSAVKFSAEFQKACDKFGLMTGNENANRLVGMRTKRINLYDLPDIMSHVEGGRGTIAKKEKDVKGDMDYVLEQLGFKEGKAGLEESLDKLLTPNSVASGASAASLGGRGRGGAGAAP